MFYVDLQYVKNKPIIMNKSLTVLRTTNKMQNGYVWLKCNSMH